MASVFGGINGCQLHGHSRWSHLLVPKHEDVTRVKSHFLAHEAVIILSIPLAGGRGHDTAV